MEIRGLFQNPRFGRALVITSVFTALFLISNIFVLGGDGFFSVANTLISPTAALVTCFLFCKASANKADSISRTLWFWMAVGFGLWGLADAIWAFYAVILNKTVPSPSVADLIWLFGYIPLYRALYIRLKTLKLTPNLRQRWLILTLNSVWVILTAVLILIPILRDFDPNRLLEGFVDLAYPLLDMGLIVSASLVLILLKEGRFSLVWRLVFSGIFIMTVSDLLYCYAAWHELYYPDGRVNLLTILSDTTYTLAYVCAGLGIYIYQCIWKLEKTFVISLATMPSSRYHAFIATNGDNQLITTSDNFYCLVNGDAETSYYKQPAGEVLGIPPETLQPLLERIRSQEVLCNEPLTITIEDHQPRQVWATAVAIFNPDREFVGINTALTADIDVAEDLRQPKSRELLGMLNYLISLAGSRPQDEIQAMRVYFLDIIQLLSSMLYQFGGAQFRDALFEELDRTIARERLPVIISDEVINLPEVKDAKDLAALLLPLLHSANRFALDLIGADIVNDDIQELERPLGATILRDLDKYNLRSFHLPA